MMQGFKTVFWPTVLMMPVIWVAPALILVGLPPAVGAIVHLCICLLPMILLPIAVVHMAQPYTYRAWLINWMLKDLFNTLAPTLYVGLMFFVLVLVLPVAALIGMSFGWVQLVSFYQTSIEGPVLGSIFSSPDMDSSFIFAFGRMPVLFFGSWLVCTIIAMVVAFPSVYMMRVFGLFGLYFRPDLSLCAEQPPLSDAGFGPRYLAFLVDCVLINLIGVAASIVALLLSKLFGFLYDSIYAENMIRVFGTLILTLGTILYYFANWESGSGRATLGKWSLGLLVMQEDNQPMPIGLAVKRTMMAWVSSLLFYIPFIICAFHPKHRAMHDTVTKTKVVWRGDENM